MDQKNLKNNQLLKLAYIIPTLDKGGAERFFVDLIKNIDRSVFSPRLILYKNGGEWLDEIKAAGIPYEILEKKRMFDFGNFLSIVKAVRHNKPDIVHTQLGGDIYGVLAARLCGVKTIISTEVNTNLNESRLYNLIKKFSLRFTTKVVAVSEAVGEDAVLRYSLNPADVEVIYNGIETERFLALPRKRITDEPIVFGALGRLEEQKGHKYLISAFKSLERGKYRLLIAGEGSLRYALSKQIEDEGLEREVELIGAVNTPDFLNKIDVFVLPSLWEGMGIVLVEAMLASKPIIASAVGGVKEVLNERTGSLVTPGDDKALLEAMLSLVSKIDSPELKAKCQMAKDEALRRFDIRQIVRKYQALYKKI